MSQLDTARQDLDYVASAIRRSDRPTGDAPIYFLWAILVPIGFALPDFAPRFAGAYWFVAGIGGGLLSWWLGNRSARLRGKVDRELGRRYGFHWLIGGVGFILAALPMVLGVIDPANGPSLFLLVGGIIYLYAGLHLDRGILPSGIVMLVAYVLLLTAKPPYLWTITGLVIAAALAWGGWRALRSGRQAAA